MAQLRPAMSTDLWAITRLEFRTFGPAPALLDRVLRAISLYLRRDGMHRIHTDSIAQQEPRNADIAELSRQPLSQPRLHTGAVSVVPSDPPKLGQNLTGLRRKAHGQVLGIMELGPFPFGYEGPKDGSQLDKIRFLAHASPKKD